LTRHILTQKHINATKELLKTTNIGDKNCDTKSSHKYQCVNCDKIYKHHSSLWKHNKCCTYIKKPIEPNFSEPTEKELIILLLKDNKVLQELVIEQIFLNEDCKDALNISEFVSTIKMELNDLETTGRLGYVEGVSRIINKNLHDLDQTMRPIHCSDIKREVFYVKNDDQWIKENEANKPVLTKAIKQIARENIKQISEWQKKHPDCTDPDSKKNDMYLNIVSNAMSGGSSEEQTKNYEKIITNMAKEVVIEKA
jgi:hypothetical protein